MLRSLYHTCVSKLYAEIESEDDDRHHDFWRDAASRYIWSVACWEVRNKLFYPDTHQRGTCTAIGHPPRECNIISKRSHRGGPCWDPDDEPFINNAVLRAMVTRSGDIRRGDWDITSYWRAQYQPYIIARLMPICRSLASRNSWIRAYTCFFFFLWCCWRYRPIIKPRGGGCYIKTDSKSRPSKKKILTHLLFWLWVK